MALSWRYSALADRHRALGSKLEDWNGMGTAWTYAKDVSEDHVAIRTKAGLMDVSGLKKLHLLLLISSFSKRQVVVGLTRWKQFVAETGSNVLSYQAAVTQLCD